MNKDIVIFTTVLLLMGKIKDEEVVFLQNALRGRMVPESAVALARQLEDILGRKL